MEKDYIKIYLDNYNREKKNYSLFVKDLIISEKETKMPFNNVCEIIQNYSYEFFKDHIVREKQFEEITEIFRYKERYIEEGSELEIISGLMYSAYNNLVSKNNNLSYEEYILELSKYYAQYDAEKLFELNQSLIELMYKQNNFDDYNINGYTVGEYRNIKNKLENKKSFSSAEEGYKTLLKKGIKNFKPDNEKNETLLNSMDFYNYLVFKEYINEELTKYVDFTNVFLSNFTENESYICFECSTKKASILLREIQTRFLKNLSFTNIALSKKFKSKNDNFLERTNLSDSFSNSSNDLKTLVRSELNYFSQKYYNKLTKH